MIHARTLVPSCVRTLLLRSSMRLLTGLIGRPRHVPSCRITKCVSPCHVPSITHDLTQ